MDYGQLAQYSQPGAALPGMEWDQIRRYQNLNTINQQALKASIPLAETNAQVEQQKAQEFMAGVPGRRDTINLSNMNAAEAILPENVARRKALAQLEDAVKDRGLREKLNNQMSEIMPYGAGYRSADPAGKKKLLDSLKGKTLNGHTFGNNPVQDDLALEAAGIVAHGQPKEQLRRDLEQTKQEGAMARLKAKGITDMQIAEFKAKHQSEIEAARIALQKNKPLTLSQLEALDLALGRPNIEDRLEYHFTKPQYTGSVAIAGGKAATAARVLAGKGIQPSAPVIQGAPGASSSAQTASPPPAATQGVEAMSREEYNNIKPNVSKFKRGNKTVTVKRKLYNEALGEYRIEFDDGSILQEKVK
jgi:hypothetical protein